MARIPNTGPMRSAGGIGKGAVHSVPMRQLVPNEMPESVAVESPIGHGKVTTKMTARQKSVLKPADGR